MGLQNESGSAKKKTFCEAEGEGKKFISLTATTRTITEKFEQKNSTHNIFFSSSSFAVAAAAACRLETNVTKQNGMNSVHGN